VDRLGEMGSDICAPTGLATYTLLMIPELEK